MIKWLEIKVQSLDSIIEYIQQFLNISHRQPRPYRLYIRLVSVEKKTQMERKWEMRGLLKNSSKSPSDNIWVVEKRVFFILWLHSDPETLKDSVIQHTPRWFLNSIYGLKISIWRKPQLYFGVLQSNNFFFDIEHNIIS